MEDAWDWAKANPLLAGLAVFGVGLLLLWLLGFFSKSSSQGASNQTAQTNLAAAYYAAEAAQATAGTQLQMATVQATNRTAQVQAQANAAQAIANAHDTAAVQATQLSTNAQNVQSNDAAATSQALGQYAYQTAVATGQAANYGTFLGTTVPTELVATGGQLGGNVASLYYPYSANATTVNNPYVTALPSNAGVIY